MNDWLVRSFHPAFQDRQWLSNRFEQFCNKKMETDILATRKRLQHATVQPRIVHKLFGRHNPVCDVLLHGDKVTFEEYMKHTVGLGVSKRHWESCENEWDRMVSAVVLTGPLADAKQLVESLRTEESMHLHILVLFELVHMTYFCKAQYLENTPKERHWIIHYFCKLAENIALETVSLDFAVDNNGLQTETLLKTVSSVMSSIIPVKRSIDVSFETTRRKSPTHVVRELTPLASSSHAFFNAARGRTLLGKTMNNTHRVSFTHFKDNC